MKFLFVVFVLNFLVSCNSRKGDIPRYMGRNINNFNQNWKFHKGEVEDGEDSELNDSTWQTVTLPHDWSIKEPFSSEWASGTGFLPGGIGWYRKSFMVPAEEKGRKVFIQFGGIYNNSTVWINDHELGTRPNGYVSFQYDMTDYIKYGEENTIAVRVDHSKFADSRWYTGSGIYRNVKLITTYPLRVKNWGVFVSTPKVTKTLAEVTVEVQVVNDLSSNGKFELENCLMFGQDTITLVAEMVELGSSDMETYTHKLQFENPLLWSPDSPSLYKLVTSIKQNGEIVDQTSETIGIREVKFIPNKGMYLNGENIKLKGICMHQDAGCLGVAVPVDVMRSRLETLKELGCNAIRLAHNPFATEFLDLCDELGFMVIDEAFDEWELPKRKWVNGWNKGNPSYDGYAHDFKKWHEQDLTDMIIRDRNHPSVIMWSIGNEIDYPTDPYSHPILNNNYNPISWARYNPRLPDGTRMGKIAWKLAAIVKKNDATRPVSAGLALSLMASEVGYANVLDVVGYNYQQKIYDLDHQNYPERMMYASEADMSYKAWQYVKENNHFVGQFLWKGLDFLGEAYEFPFHTKPTGLIDLIGKPKNEYYYRKSLWSEKPVIFISAVEVSEIKDDVGILRYKYHAKWDYKENEVISIAAFTNCDEIELRLNGKLISRKEMTENDENMAIFTIPFSKGELVAIGKSKGKKEVICNLNTPSEPIKLLAKANKSVVKANMSDVIQVYVNITDVNNNVVTTCDRTINCEIEGPLRLLAMGDANPENTERYADNNQFSYKGCIVAYFQVLDRAGDASVTFSANNLESDSLNITILDNKK